MNGSAGAATRYVGWAPVPARIRLVDGASGAEPVLIRLRNLSTQGGQVVFYPAIPGTSQAELQIPVPADGTPVDFHLAGRFERPSITDGDAGIAATEAATGDVLGTMQLMVRVRKDAMKLTSAERDRFLAAIAAFNDRGMGRFSDFRNVHNEAGDPEAHGNAGFLPWHRAFLLDLERELQQIDPSVTLPYWRFDQAAPRVFSRDFMGVPDPATGTVQFSAANPLQFWVTDGVPGIIRRPRFNTVTQPATSANGQVLSELATLALGGPGAKYESFRTMEGNPHGRSHNSFGGSIAGRATAAKDPLFFMLHANIDRLWAKWQVVKRRFDATKLETYSRPGKATDPGATSPGHNLEDTMWPWNKITTPPRPPTAPGGTMATSPITSAPGPSPTVRAMIDPQGVLTPSGHLGFDYDDVPFEFISTSG